mmetsp:Transcript_16966/g.25469  ORF Transcript_16966/g.25469 Transcript_16966/m.25469 type:complete len:476 (+) Transcript_16966:40-1467(+)|eukprot:CAMPEP_0167753794 /NCGR_PEP_ID=MMETSP0110_2-20121227/7910_1 /TAXON_ID=629695 /ORGANISM="Gymnochlora sp., Strain CCMP2014" /LENGTH=475 /DNA_ID=CAMNT_0007639597 /DNA_START=39 /DNA_END=1466 /DNA_ORIENTATION=+
MFRGFFPGGGGFPGMGRMEEEEPADTQKLYDLLGIEKTANQSQVRKAFHKAARKHHPDRGGDAEKFKEIQKAYEILGDESKRELYDMGGEKAVEQGAMRRRRNPRAARPPDVNISVSVSIRDVCLGILKKLEFEVRQATKRSTCSACGGKGYNIRLVQMGPGMAMRTQVTCNVCKGKGFIFEDEKLVNMKKDARIPKGVKSGDKIKLMGDGHSLPGMEPGDVIVHCQVEKDPKFERLGADLAMKKEITLKQALCGYSFVVEHPSGTKLNIKSKAQEIITPDLLTSIEGWGLPQKGGHEVKGNLYIKFKILFPVEEKFSEADRKEILGVLDKLSYPQEEEVKITLGMGVHVKLVNLGNAQFNGKSGRIIGDNARGGRWPVELASGKKVSVPEACLKILHKKNKQKAAKAARKATKMAAELDEEGETNTTSTPELQEEKVVLKKVDGDIKRTPATAPGSSNYDSDEEEEGGVQCQTA